MKLTPSTIKQMIAEEREKLSNERKRKIFEQLKLLKKIKDKQVASINEAKELQEAKDILIKRIKGSK